MSVMPGIVQYRNPVNALNIILTGVSANQVHPNPHPVLELPDSKTILIGPLGDIVLGWQSLIYFPRIEDIDERMAHGIELPPKRTVRNLSSTFPDRRTIADPSTFRFRLEMDVQNQGGVILPYSQEVAIVPSEHRTDPVNHVRQVEFVRVSRLYWRLQSQVIGV